MRFAAVKDCNLVSAAERIPNLIRAGESGAAENENVHWFDGLFPEQFAFANSKAECAAGNSRDLDESAARSRGCIHVRAKDTTAVRTSLGLVRNLQHDLAARMMGRRLLLRLCRFR